MDIIQDAPVDALCLAARQYDPARGKFSSYAAVCMRRQILKEAGRYAGSGRIPSDAYLDEKRLRLAADRFRKHYGIHTEELGSAEVAMLYGLSRARINQISAHISAELRQLPQIKQYAA